MNKAKTIVTVSDAAKAKRDLEQDIYLMIRDYETRFVVHVADIRSHTTPTLTGRRSTFAVSITAVLLNAGDNDVTTEGQAAGGDRTGD